MEAFVIAVAIFALLSAGGSAGLAAAGYTRTKTAGDYSFEAFCWLAFAGGALWVWLS